MLYLNEKEYYDCDWYLILNLMILISKIILSVMIITQYKVLQLDCYLWLDTILIDKKIIKEKKFYT